MMVPNGSLNSSNLKNSNRKIFRIGRRLLTNVLVLEEAGSYRVYARNTYTGYRQAYLQAITQDFLNRVIANVGSKKIQVDHNHAKKTVKDNIAIVDEMGEEGEKLLTEGEIVYILVGATSANLNRSYGANDDIETLVKKLAGLPMDASAEKTGDALNAILAADDDGEDSALKAGYIIPSSGIERECVRAVVSKTQLTPSEQSTLENLF